MDLLSILKILISFLINLVNYLITNPLGELLILMSIVFLIPLIMERTNFPMIFGLVLAGIIIGPHGLKLVSIDSNLNLLQGIGISYIMFIAGLELDIDKFLHLKGKSFLFACLTGLLPGLLSFGFAIELLRLPLLSSIVVAITVASHTVVEYPYLSKIQVGNEESILVTLGATIITDSICLSILGITLAINIKGSSFSLVPLLIFIIGIVFYVLILMFILPYFSRLFFQKTHSSDVEFQFTFIVMLFTALFAELFGLDQVIGAFIGGLALNRLIPKDSRLMNITEFFGRAFFIPVFTIYIGMLINLGAIFDGIQTIIISLVFLISLFVGKYIAAFIVGKIYHYQYSNYMTMFGLTLSQAGVALACLFLGVQSGLLSNEYLSAGIIFLTISDIASPLISHKYGRKMAQSKKVEIKSLNKFEITKNVLMPISNMFSEPRLVDLGCMLVKQGEGTLFPIHVMVPQKDQLTSPELTTDSDSADKILKKIISLGNEFGIKLYSLKHVDDNIPEGILNSALEINASLILFDLKGDHPPKNFYFSEAIDIVLRKTRCPVAIAKFTTQISLFERIIVFLTQYELVNPFTRNYILLVRNISKSLGKKIIILDVSTLDFEWDKVLTNISPDFRYEFQKFKIISSRKLNNFLTPNDFIIGTIPPNFPVFHDFTSKNRSFSASDDAYFYSIRSLSISMLLLYLPKL